MTQAAVISKSGEKIGHLEMDSQVFDVQVSSHLMWEAIKAQLACLRAGTHSTLRRSEVRGGGRKPYKQKGTGRARQGSIRSPQFVGGGSVFGPKPRDYTYRMPKQSKVQTLAAALSDCARQGRLWVLQKEAFSVEKSKAAVSMLQKLGCSRLLVVVSPEERSSVRGFENLVQAKVLLDSHLNVYDILRQGNVLISGQALQTLESRLKGCLVGVS